MSEKKIDFIKDEGFRGLISFLREAQREFDQAETDDAIRLSQAKLNYARALIDSHVRRAKQNRNLLREVNLNQYKNMALSNRTLSKVSNYMKRQARRDSDR